MINFSGLEFIFRFLPIFLVIYYIAAPKYRNMILILGSLFFYAVGEPIFFLLLILLTGLNYLLGKKAGQFRNAFKIHKWQKKEMQKWMIGAVVLDVSVLVVFKVLATFTDNILLPLGISFYIFKMIAYQVDLCKGEIRGEVSFSSTMLYFTLFPQVISGPVMRYEEGHFAGERQYSLAQFEEGLTYLVMGLGMKVLLADRLSILWNDLQMIGFQSISTPLAWFGAVGYSLRLYFDFWGYSLMASGIMVMLGFDFIENFRHPYSAKSIGEFYRKWHMTLGSFFRDYVYIPMGGSRCDKKKLVRNLAVVWLLTGIWHGNGLNFVIWGVVLGLLIISEKLFYGKYLNQYSFLGHLYVILLMPLTWVIFAITDLEQLLIYFGRLFPFIGGEGIAVNSLDIVRYGQSYGIMVLIGVILCIPAVFDKVWEYRKNVIVLLALTVIFWYSVYFMASSSGNPFMYLDF